MRSQSYTTGRPSDSNNNSTVTVSSAFCVISTIRTCFNFPIISADSKQSPFLFDKETEVGELESLHQCSHLPATLLSGLAPLPPSLSLLALRELNKVPKSLSTYPLPLGGRMDDPQPPVCAHLHSE